MDIDGAVNYGNSYVNIPYSVLKNYWFGEVFGFGAFIVHVLAFGTATKQILEYRYDDNELEATTESAEDNLELFLEAIDDYDAFCEAKNKGAKRFRSLVLKYSEWIDKNGGEEWTKHGKWVGITVYNLHKMLLERREFIQGTDSRKHRERMEQKWLIYFGLKSTIGQKAYFECSWDCILNRSLGFISKLDYDNANLGDNDWTIPFRIKRKTKDKMIERLKNEFGLIYNPTGCKGCDHKKCRWSFKKQ